MRFIDWLFALAFWPAACWLVFAFFDAYRAAHSAGAW